MASTFVLKVVASTRFTSAGYLSFSDATSSTSNSFPHSVTESSHAVLSCCSFPWSNALRAHAHSSFSSMRFKSPSLEARTVRYSFLVRKAPCNFAAKVLLSALMGTDVFFLRATLLVLLDVLLARTLRSRLLLATCV